MGRRLVPSPTPAHLIIMHWFCLASSILAKARFAIAKRWLERQVKGFLGRPCPMPPNLPVGGQGAPLPSRVASPAPRPLLGECSCKAPCPELSLQFCRTAACSPERAMARLGRGCWATHHHLPRPPAQTGPQETPGYPLSQPQRHSRGVLGQGPPAVLLHLLRPVNSKHLVRVHRHQDAADVRLLGRQWPQCLSASLPPLLLESGSLFCGDRCLAAWPWCLHLGP